MNLSWPFITFLCNMIYYFLYWTDSHFRIKVWRQMECSSIPLKLVEVFDQSFLWWLILQKLIKKTIHFPIGPYIKTAQCQPPFFDFWSSEKTNFVKTRLMHISAKLVCNQWRIWNQSWLECALVLDGHLQNVYFLVLIKNPRLPP
jgi:hypothetical protein